MAKRALSYLLVVALCIAPIQQASAATAKAGMKCSKIKATSIVKGKKFTCIKSGKNLVWNKGVTVKASITCPKLDSADQAGISQIRANALIGMSESKAEECAKSLNWGFRIGQRDDEMFALTRDYRLDRVTVIVMLGIVTRVDVG